MIRAQLLFLSISLGLWSCIALTWSSGWLFLLWQNAISRSQICISHYSKQNPNLFFPQLTKQNSMPHFDWTSMDQSLWPKDHLSLFGPTLRSCRWKRPPPQTLLDAHCREKGKMGAHPGGLPFPNQYFLLQQSSKNVSALENLPSEA